jgi:hypothetical protein
MSSVLRKKVKTSNTTGPLNPLSETGTLSASLSSRCGSFSAETSITVIENHSATNAARSRRGEERGEKRRGEKRRGEERREEERRERGDRSDAYAQHGLKGKESKGLCCDGPHLAVRHDM